MRKGAKGIVLPKLGHMGALNIGSQLMGAKAMRYFSKRASSSGNALQLLSLPNKSNMCKYRYASIVNMIRMV